MTTKAKYVERRFIAKHGHAPGRAKNDGRDVTNHEIARQRHMVLEDSGPANEHPDGCFYCGSRLHMTTDCVERDC